MDVFVTEYSPRQKAFHVDVLTDVIWKNRRALLDGQKPDFILLGLFGSSEEAHAFADDWRRRLDG